MIRRNAVQFITRTRLMTFLLLIALAFATLPALPAHAATINLDSQSSCEALGGLWSREPQCRFYNALNVAAGDVLNVSVWVVAGNLTNNGTIHFVGGGDIWTAFSATNNGTITLASGSSISIIQGDFTNNGTITVSSGGSISNGDATFTNNGTITACSGSVAGTISGNPPQDADCTGPSVTVNQAAEQADPTKASPINFTVVFGENVTGFTSSDVALSGTAGATSAVVTGSGSIYNVAVSGMSTRGTIIVSIPAGAVKDAAGNDSSASTSTDNTVTFISDSTAPVITPTVAGTLGSNGWYVSDVTVSWSVTDPESTITSQVGCDSSSVSSDTSGVTFTCTATSAGGTASKSVTIKRDATNPSVSYTGNAGTYTIDQSVSILCTAADNLSGIASSTCANISGPAYAFALGTNTRSASVTDNAGNTGSGSTTFTVGVTFDSLCTLSVSFSTDPAVDTGLCDKLAAAKAAAASGNSKTKNNNLAAYRQQVSAQSGKALTKQQASILTNLSKAL
jgi:hypothetical protein